MCLNPKPYNLTCFWGSTWVLDLLSTPIIPPNIGLGLHTSIFCHDLIHSFYRYLLTILCLTQLGTL